MLVCAHGNVMEYCDAHGLRIYENWYGEITDYSGSCRMIVTDKEMSAQEFYYLRLVMLSKGYEVLSVHYPDIDEKLKEFMEYVSMQERNRRKEIYGGRQPFGYVRRKGEVVENPAMMTVARQIIEMKDAGHTLRMIHDEEGIRHPDGRKISISTIQQIIKNRERYEK